MIFRLRKSSVEAEDGEWDSHSVIMYQAVINLGYSDIMTGYNEGTGKPTEWKYRIEYYFSGEKLRLSQRGFFEYPIIYRYEPKVRKAAKYMAKNLRLIGSGLDCQDHWKDDDQWAVEEAIWESSEEILRRSKDYDPERGVLPRGYLGNTVKWAGKKYWEEHSTTNIPGSAKWENPPSDTQFENCLLSIPKRELLSTQPTSTQLINPSLKQMKNSMAS